MRTYRGLIDWLETRWVAPAYSGWLLGGLGLFFFAAATNTMAGWLYVISGVIFALLAIAAVLPKRSLREVQVSRKPISPVSVGEMLTMNLRFENLTHQPKTLIEVRDLLPQRLASPAETSIEVIPARGLYDWVYTQPTQRRGLYRWHTVSLRTATPLGLFWCRQQQSVKATATVYPTVLPLAKCPLVDNIGQAVNPQVQHHRRELGATEGVTQSLRPYRWGDPIRLVHWRTSARYGELRVRELEVYTGGREVVIGLDSAIAWDPEDFEQAVIAAASLYFYAVRQDLEVSLWTAGTGLLRGEQAVLLTLAGTQAGEESRGDRRPQLPLIWLSQSAESFQGLPEGSQRIFWPPSPQATATQSGAPPSGLSNSLSNSIDGLTIQPDQPLQIQLQAAQGR